jgi:hypothetical protein
MQQLICSAAELKDVLWPFRVMSRRNGQDGWSPCESIALGIDER